MAVQSGKDFGFGGGFVPKNTSDDEQEKVDQRKYSAEVDSKIVANRGGGKSGEYVLNRPLGSSIINDFESWKSTLSTNTKTEANTFLPRQRTGTSSYINEYAFISYGGDYFSGNTSANTFASGESLQGFVSQPEQWKNPTAKNIIEWSRSLSTDRKINSQYDVNKATSGDQGIYDDQMNVRTDINVTTETVVNTGTGGAVSYKNQDSSGVSQENNSRVGNINSDTTSVGIATTLAQKQGDKIAGSYGSGGSIQGVGNFKYDWKDFSFCKNYGKIPNNRLLTLRRFKLPVLDNGVVSAKESIVKRIGDNLLNPGQSKSDYISSDSARALTYFGDGTNNTLNGIFGFTVGLSWTPESTSAGNPGYNNNITSSGTNYLTDPIDGLTLLDKTLDLRGTNIKDRLRLITAAALQAQVGFDKDVQSKVYESLDNDPFLNGWQYNVYGPINVLLKTHRRTRGLKFDQGSISLTFEYDLTQVGTLNPKVAGLDIISNMLALCYNSGSFWGGDYRFKREVKNVPLPDELRDALERASNGATADYNKITLDVIQGFYKKYQDMTSTTPTTVGPQPQGGVAATPSVPDIIKNLISGTVSALTTSEESEYSTLSAIPEKTRTTDQAKRFTELDNKNKITNSANFAGVLENLLNKSGTALSNFAQGATGQNVIRIVVNSLLGNKGDLKSLSKNLMRVKPLMTGEPVGEWHLTVGNPMNPIAVIGNLICTGMKMSFEEELGVDDFPTSLKFTVNLDHGRDRDKGDIESMFNMGQGRFYLNIQGRQPWETGFSVGNTLNNTGSVSDAQDQGNKLNKKGEYQRVTGVTPKS